MCASCFQSPLAVAENAADIRIHVSPSGNDNASGSATAPFGTVYRAQQAAREALVRGKGGVVVELGAGVYPLDRPLTLTHEDSGREGAAVTYRSADGIGKARLLGSTPLTGWEEFRDGIWRTTLPKGVLFHTLYENGTRAHKARFPNHEHHPRFPSARGRYLITEDGTPKHHDRGGDVPTGPGWLIYPDGEPPPPLSGSKAKLLIYTGGKCDWVRSMFDVRSVDPATRKLVFEAKRMSFGVGKGARFFIEDDLSFLDAKGEFYVDEESQTVYYKPMGNGHPDELGITRAVVNRLIEAKGASPEECVTNVCIEGLALEETDCLPHRPSWAYTGHTDGALIWLTNAANVVIRNCHLKNGGRHGIMVVGHNTGHLITGCWIEHMGLNGVSFANRFLAADGRSPTDRRCEGNRVHDTHISHVGEIHTYAECVTVFHASHNEVDHCVLDNSVRYGITVRGNTGAQYGPLVTNSFPPSKGNHFHHIRVSRCGQDGGDMGALHCANLNVPGGGSVNTFEQITVADTRAIPSVRDIGCDGIFLDWPKMAMDQVFRNVHIVRSQGRQLRSHGADNGASAQTHNVSWKPGFDPTLMDYENIGLTDDFPIEFGGRRTSSATPPAPRGLTVETPSHYRAVVTWEAPEHDFREDPLYTVFRDGKAIASVNALAFTDTGLREQTAYRYEVAAQDGDFCHPGPRTDVCDIRTPVRRAGASPAGKAREAHFPMQLMEDGLLMDCGGGARNARLIGGAVVEEGSGPFGGPALVLDGKTGYAEASGDLDFRDGDFTIILWMKREGGGHIVLSQGNGFGSAGQWSFGWPGQDLKNSASFRVNNQFHSTTADAIPVDKWVHLAFVRHGDQGFSYVNGKLNAGPHDLSKAGPFISDQPLRIGRRAHEPDPQYFRGKITEVRLLGYALATEDILALAHGKSPSPTE